MNEFSLSVSELNEYVHDKLQMDPMLKLVTVRGEIGEYKQQSVSGHAYFTLKDDKAVIPCTMWRSNVSLLRFIPRPGKKVLVRGQVTLYVAGGKYQLVADSMKEEGVGDLFAQFEALKNRLLFEGLFDPQHKKPIPLFSKTIGIATSLSGAAIRDMIKVARARNPRIDIVIAPCAVQGKGAENEISAAIDLLDRDGRADVILVGRGGGSMEDLWAFNEEVVARAIYRCSKPVISCVGHETDFTIADFVADIRASTPSNAAELAVADVQELHRHLDQLMQRLSASMLNANKQRMLRLENAFNRRVFRDPMSVFITDRQTKLTDLHRHMDNSIQQRLQADRTRCDHLMRLLENMNPDNIKQRGYAIVRRKKDIVGNVDMLAKEDQVNVELADGMFAAKVQELWRNSDGKQDQL